MIITVIIPLYRAEEYLKSCVLSLRRSAINANIQLEIIIVVNDLKLKSNGFIFPSNCKLIFPQNNLGFGKAINLASKKAIGEWLGVINSDTFTKKTAFKYLFRKIPKNFAVIAPKILNKNGTVQHSILDKITFWNIFKEQSYLYKLFPSIFVSNQVGNSQYETEHETDFIAGSYLFIKKDLFIKLGGFFEGFFMYFEDYDLCLRIRSSGYKILFRPKSIVIHYNHSSTGGLIKADYFLKSLWIYLNRNYNYLYSILCIFLIFSGYSFRLIFWRLRFIYSKNNRKIFVEKKSNYYSEFLKETISGILRKLT